LLKKRSAAPQETFLLRCFFMGGQKNIRKGAVKWQKQKISPEIK